METGICVTVKTKLDRCGNRVQIASHKRDSTTNWRVRLQATDPAEALNAWIERFTNKQIGAKGFVASFKIAARGSDREGCFYVLVPTAYN